MSHEAELCLFFMLSFFGLGGLYCFGLYNVRTLVLFVAMVMAAIGCDLAFGFVGSYCNALPTLPCLWAALAGVLSFPVITSELGGRLRQVVKTVSLLACGIYITIFAAGYVVEFVQNTGLWEPRFINKEPIQAKGWEHVFFETQTEGNYAGVDFAKKYNAALDLIESEDEKIFVVDQNNPYPLFRHLPFPKGLPVFAGAWATYNATDHPDATNWLGDVNYVLIPRQACENQSGVNLELSLIGSYLAAHFQAVAKNDYWVLLQSKPVTNVRLVSFDDK
jgi:hypothetical protein